MEFFVRDQIDSPGFKIFGGAGGGGVFFCGIYRLGFGYLAVPGFVTQRTTEESTEGTEIIFASLRLRDALNHKKHYAVSLNRNPKDELMSLRINSPQPYKELLV